MEALKLTDFFIDSIYKTTLVTQLVMGEGYFLSFPSLSSLSAILILDDSTQTNNVQPLIITNECTQTQASTSKQET